MSQEQQNNQAAPTVLQKSIADQVLQKIQMYNESGGLKLPPKYSAENALRLGWLLILETKNLDKRPALEVCTRESVANALLKMIVMGLNPVKRQCSFIVYGNQLTCQREYQGTIAIAKRHGVKEVFGAAVFKGDEFEFITNPKTGYKEVLKHTQTLESLESMTVLAAYATKVYEDGRSYTEVMSMGQIRKAWEQGQTKGNSPAHKNFPDQMAIKTVIGRLLKPDVNSSDDADLFDDEDTTEQDTQVVADVKHEISTQSNGATTAGAIGFEEVPENVDTNTGEVLDAPAPTVQESKPVVMNGTPSKVPF